MFSFWPFALPEFGPLISIKVLFKKLCKFFFFLSKFLEICFDFIIIIIVVDLICYGKPVRGASDSVCF